MISFASRHVVHVALVASVLALPCFGCSAAIEAEDTEAAEGELRNSDDVLVQEMTGRIAAVDASASGVAVWKVFLAETKAGEQYVVARGYGKNGSVAIVDIDLTASKPDRVEIQSLGEEFVVNEQRLAALAKEMERLAFMGTDREGCERGRWKELMSAGAKTLATQAAVGLFCTVGMATVVGVGACAVSIGTMIANAINQGRRNPFGIDCSALPK